MTNTRQWGIIAGVIAVLGTGLYLASTKLGADDGIIPFTTNAEKLVNGDFTQCLT